jgi:protein translocase subunit secA
MFEAMEASIMDQIANLMYHVSIVTPQTTPPMQSNVAPDGMPAPVADPAAAQRAHELLARERSKLEDHLRTARTSHGGESAPAEARAEKGEDGKKIGRNDPCPCGSGKKYKNCHGKA